MKIVLISSLLAPKSIGGIEVLTILLSQGLTALGHDVSVITGGDRGRVRIQGVKTVEIPELVLPLQLKSFLMPYYEIKIRNRLRSLSEIREADIINAMDLDSIVSVAGWPETAGRMTATIQDYGLVCANGLLLYGTQTCPNFCHQGKGFLCLEKRKISAVHKAYLHAAYTIRKRYRDRKLNRLTNAVCVSRFVENQITSVSPHIKTTVIGNSLPDAWTNATKKSISRDIDVLYAGRLEEFKGIEVLLDALQTIIKPLNVYLVGGGKTDIYADRIRKLGMPHSFTMARSENFMNMQSYYERSKVVVAPSVWPEPCGRVIIEGMVFGAVVISTRRGGTPELITNKRDGILIPAGNPAVLASSIKKLLADTGLRVRISKNASETARTQFRQQLVARAYETYYHTLITKGNAS